MVLELKVKHQGDCVTFLNLKITIKECIFVYNLFDNRDFSPFSNVRIPPIESNIK